MASLPFISITLSEGGAATVEGSSSCLLGHRIPRAGAHADGIYAWWSWRDGTLRAECDRYGFRPLFYWCDGKRFIASPSLLALAVRLPERKLDPVALAVFWHMGYLVGDLTPLEGVRVLSPAERLEWNGRLALSTARALGVPSPDIGFDDAVDGYIERFRASIERRPPEGEFTLPLSGGRDSRHILFELCRQGHRPAHCVSSFAMPPNPSVDVAVAREVCAAVGTGLIEVRAPNRFTAEYRRSLRSSLCSDEGEWMFGLIDHIVGRYRTIWDGAAGDTLSASRLQQPADIEIFQSGRYEVLAERLIGRNVGPMIATMQPSLRMSDLRSLARDAVAAELKRVEGAANPLAMFYLYNRGRREIGLMSTAMLAGVPRAYLPFLDHDLFDFLAGVPHEIRHRGDFHDAAIARAYPEWAHVPYAPKQTGRAPAAIPYTLFGARAALYAIGHDPGWLLRLPRAAGQWLRFGLSAKARRSQRWLSPGRMMQAVLFEQLRDDPGRLLRDLEREPGVGEQGAAFVAEEPGVAACRN